MKKYIIMCGGEYPMFSKPKPLSVIKGETLVERTIRLLKENGIEDIAISTNNPMYDYIDIEKLHHSNNYEHEYSNIEPKGYWLDAYYPMTEPCVYLHGDVYYTDEAIKKIINCKSDKNIFIGNAIALNPEHKNWGEPFGWIINKPDIFRKGIELAKYLQDIDRCERKHAISWELYRVLNGLDINKMYIYEDTYLVIDDETIDIDTPYQIEELNKKLR